MGLENRELTAPEKSVLARLRKIAAKLPGVSEERDKFGHTTLKFRKKSLAILGLNPEGVASLAIKTDLVTQAALIKGKSFYRTRYVGQHGWVSADGPASKMEWRTIEHLIADTYQTIAPRKR